MAIRVECGNCSFEYDIQRKHAGKKFRCKECGTILRVPAPKRRSRAVSADVDDEWDDDDLPAAKPSRRSQGSRRPAYWMRQRRQRPERTGLSTGMLMLIGACGLLLLFGLALTSTIVAVPFVMLFAFAVMTVVPVGVVWLIFAPFQEGLLHGLLCLLFSPYLLLFTVMHWSTMRNPVYTLATGGVLAVMVYTVLVVRVQPLLNGLDVQPTATDDPERPWIAAIRETIEQPTQPFPVSQVEPVFGHYDENAAYLSPKDVRIVPIRFPSGGKPYHLPGRQMSMKMYLPAGTHAAQSLPCVLVPPAGTNLITGSFLDRGVQNPEHMPYVENGFVVISFSLDGPLPNPEQASIQDLSIVYRLFHAAYAGLVNCRNALEFAIQSVEEVDPQQIYIAGHSSAGTLALLFAAHEPRIRGCIAYAPETDVEAFVGEFRHQLPGSEFPGLVEFSRRSSPKTHLARIDCPVFLVHARDDSVVPFARSQSFCDELQRLGKHVTFVPADNGDHYNSMLAVGIPSALNWLRHQTNQPPER